MSNNQALNTEPFDQGWVVTPNMTPPSLQDNTADVDRLCQAIRRQLNCAFVEMDLDLARRVPDTLRANDYAVRCVVVQDQDRGVVLNVLPIRDSAAAAGLAVDLGTTRVVVRLVDLDRQKVLIEEAFDNPQIEVGPDILARIHFADHEAGPALLQQTVVERLNTCADQLCHRCGLSTKNLHLISVAGNTTMSHLMAGLPVRGIIREPYIPAMNRFGLMRASDLGIRAGRRARIMMFPCVGSYLGGDIIAGILFSGLDQHKETSLLVDVGTNAEVVLGNREWLMACAGAAGPALEGGVSRIGAQAKPGVIDQVRIDPLSRKFEVHTIGNLPPAGICGSGFIDLAAGLFNAGMLDIRGKLSWENCDGHMTEQNGIPHLVIAVAADGRPLCISQADMDSLVRSKAAMFTILETITMTMGMDLSDIDTFHVAGTFGAFIDPRSAVTIGMLPDLPMNRFRTLGNSSLGGATMALLDRRHWLATDRIRDSITYLELNVNQDFMNRFSAAKFLPHTDPGRFPSVSIPRR